MMVNGFNPIKLKELRHTPTETFIQANLCQILGTVKDDIQNKLMDPSLKVNSILVRYSKESILKLTAQFSKANSNMTS